MDRPLIHQNKDFRETPALMASDLLIMTSLITRQTDMSASLSMRRYVFLQIYFGFTTGATE